MPNIKCFLIVPTDRCTRALRRYRSSSGKDHLPCPKAACFNTHPQYAYHNAEVLIEEGYARKEPEIEWLKRIGADAERIANADPSDWIWQLGPQTVDKTDPRWPTQCACGYTFESTDEWQVFCDVIYRSEDGREFSLRNAPPGAMWDTTDWSKKFYPPTPDGKFWTVQTPGGEWCIDSRASNCTMKDDNIHKCWVRHGVAPDFTIDKNGNTCQAGAGSILCGNYHGFLRGGYLVDA